MPDGTGTALTPAQQFNQQLDRYAANFAVMLPKHIPVERFKRAVVTAVAQNPDLMRSETRSLLMAAQKCASDGLLPDGREAVLLPFNTKMKRKLQDGTQQDVWVSLVTYIPMIQGIRQRMRNTGLVTSAEAQVVHRNDKFFQKFGSDPQIVHEPPPLGTGRGEPVGAYAIIRLTSGEVIQEVMDHAEIERVRSFSKAKDGPAWKNHWGEMARKTVLRRAAKSAPTSAEMQRLLERDDDELPVPDMVDVTVDPEPPRQIEQQDAVEPEVSLAVTDNDGEVHEYATVEGAAKAIEVVFVDAKRRGRKALDAAAENNQTAMLALNNAAPDAAQALVQLWHDLVKELDPFGLPATASSTPAAVAQDQPNSPAGDATTGKERLHGTAPPAGEAQQQQPDEAVDHGWLKAVAELKPQPVDLAGDELDWKGYADALVKACATANGATRGALPTAKMPHLQKLRTEYGDGFRAVMAAVAGRVP